MKTPDLRSRGIWAWLAIVEKEGDKLSRGGRSALALLRQDLESFASDTTLPETVVPRAIYVCPTGCGSVEQVPAGPHAAPICLRGDDRHGEGNGVVMERVEIREAPEMHTWDAHQVITARAMLQRIVVDWPYQPPEVIQPEMEAIRAWLADPKNHPGAEAHVAALRAELDLG